MGNLCCSMSSRRLVLSILATTLGALTFASGQALALQRHVYGSSFGSEGSGGGQFKEPAGVAVSEVGGSSGDVYVVDRGNNRVEVFSSTGTYLSQFNGAAAPTGAFSSPESIAVDNSTNPLDPSAGDVYVTDTGHNVIDKFTGAGTYLGQIATGEGGAAFSGLAGVAVDPNGVVWVYDGLGTRQGKIDSYSDEEPNKFLPSSRESRAVFEVGSGLAVDSEDNFYVVHSERSVVAKLNNGGIAIPTIPPQELGGEGPKTGLAVESSSNDVYIDSVHAGARVERFAANGFPIETFGSGHLAAGSGLVVNSSSGVAYVACFPGRKLCWEPLHAITFQCRCRTPVFAGFQHYHRSIFQEQGGIRRRTGWW